MSKCREEFEDWLASELCEDFKDGVFDVSACGVYKLPSVRESWAVWRASWKRCEEVGKDESQD